jgi:hypothetical protein
MRLVVGVTTYVLLAAAAMPVHAQTGPVRATFGGRMHFQLNSTSVGAPDLAPGAPRPAPATFEQRRIRLSADVQVSDWIRGRIEPEFAMGRLGVKSAWLAFDLDSLLVLRAGQMKRPFGLISTTSSGVLPVIERGVRIRGLDGALRAADADGRLQEMGGSLLFGEQFTLAETLGHSVYDMGVTAEGRAGRLAWTAGLFNGAGQDTRAAAAGLSPAARATWQVPVAAPLRLGAAWSRRSMDWPTPGAAETRTGNAFGVDAELGSFRRGGLWVLAEANTGDDMVSGDAACGGGDASSGTGGTIEIDGSSTVYPVTEAVAEEFGAETGGACA